MQLHPEHKLIIFFLLVFSISFSSAVLLDNPYLPLVKTEVTTTPNASSNSSLYWITTDYGPLNAVSQIVHNALSGLQGGTSGEYYHLTGAQHTYIGANLFDFLLQANLTAALANIHDQDLNTTDNVTFVKLNLTCGTFGNETCLNVSGDINIRDIYARDGYFSNSTLYIGDQIKLSASGVAGAVLNITGGNVSADAYFGSGQYLTDLNLSNISFAGDTINASVFNGDQFNGGNFTGDNFTGTNAFFDTYDLNGVAPWIIFDGKNISFNESELKNEAEVRVRTSFTQITTVAGSGSNITLDTLKFQITEIKVVPPNGNKYRFEASETGTGDIIDADLINHFGTWTIAKSYAINDTVTLNLSNVVSDGTFNITIKYLDNFILP